MFILGHCAISEKININWYSAAVEERHSMWKMYVFIFGSVTYM